jgi:uncharacterized protein YndB with AHSA1/START domain
VVMMREIVVIRDLPHPRPLVWKALTSRDQLMAELLDVLAARQIS